MKWTKKKSLYESKEISIQVNAYKKKEKKGKETYGSISESQEARVHQYSLAQRPQLRRSLEYSSPAACGRFQLSPG